MFLILQKQKKISWILLLTLAGFFCACQKKVEHAGRHPLVQVGTVFLYEEDLEAIIPVHLSATDSTIFADRYIRHWIEEEMLYEKAEKNVRDSRRLERMVEDYRRSLIMHEYRQLLIRQDLAEQLEETDLQTFYENNKSLFVLEEPVLKGVFIKAPLTAPDLKDLKKWYKDGSEEALEKLEKFALRNTVIYEYFYDHWVTVSDIEGKIAINLAERGKDFDKIKDIETEDKEFCYLLGCPNEIPLKLRNGNLAIFYLFQKDCQYFSFYFNVHFVHRLYKFGKKNDYFLNFINGC